MERRTRRHRSASEREAMVMLFEGSGLSVGQFCRREGVSSSSFNRWRSQRRAVRRAGQSLVPTETTSSFVDLGALSVGRERFELRLDLGGGMVLQLARG